MKRVLAFVGLFPFFACGPVDPMPVASDVRATATIDALTVELLAAEPLHVGFNAVRYRVTAGGEAMAHASMKQLSTCGALGGPVVNPDHHPTDDGLFPGVLIFPSAGDWSVALDVTLVHGQPPQHVVFSNLPVAGGAMVERTARDGRPLLLGAGLAEPAHVGLNTFVVTAHVATDADRTTWTTVPDLTLAAIPEMPEMGHGSANNVAPTISEDGAYRGRVNLSMPGEWLVHVTVTDATGELGRFDATFNP